MSELINNRTHRVETLRRIVLHLHQGQPADAVRQELATIVKETDATEIAAMEQELMANGVSVEEVTSMCDLHAQVLRDVIRPSEIAAVPPGHPVDTFRRENQALLETIRELRQTAEKLLDGDDEPAVGRSVERARALSNALFDIERHYARKEHLLFPMLERHGITAPSKVMWAKDDEVRALVRDLGDALGVEGADLDEIQLVVEAVGGRAAAAIEEMIYKEEQILLPMAFATLTTDEWNEIWLESPRIGWCLVEPQEGYRPASAAGPRDPVTVPLGREIVLPTGHVTIDQLEAIFAALPLDLTFVDADDRVAFFSEGPRRIFARSKAIIGRRVQHCHPPRSVAIVDRILEDFRAGRESVAEFWIDFHGRFVHIRYFAVRDAGGRYLGCLEVTQDVAGIRALEGERRLLQYADRTD